jgi:hypothetical protein
MSSEINRELRPSNVRGRIIGQLTANVARKDRIHPIVRDFNSALISSRGKKIEKGKIHERIGKRQTEEK